MKKILLLFMVLTFMFSTVFAVELVRQKNANTYIYFPLIDSDGDVVTSAAGLDTEIDTWTDAIAPNGYADLDSEAVEVGGGWYRLGLSATQMNVDYIAIMVKTSTVGAKTQHILIRTMVGDPLLASTNSDGAAITTVSGVVSTVTTTTTATNLTNAPTVGDLTATMKTSVAAAVWNTATSSYATDNTFGGDALDNDMWTDTKAGYVDEAISGIDDNPWDNTTRTLTGTQTFNNTGTWTGNVTGNLSGTVGQTISIGDTCQGNLASNIWNKTITGYSYPGTPGAGDAGGMLRKIHVVLPSTGYIAGEDANLNIQTDVASLNGWAPTTDAVGSVTGAVGSVTGLVQANVLSISADTTAANNFETMLDGTGGKKLSLASLEIRASGNDTAFIAIGFGSGHGFFAKGGATGHGIYGLGGATSGDGWRGEAATSGYGAQLKGAGTVKSGLYAFGGTTGHGILAQGGSTSGDGVVATGGADGDGIEAVGTGTGIDIKGDITGNLTGSVGSVVGQDWDQWDNTTRTLTYPDSAAHSRIIKRVGWGLTPGSGSDSTTWAQRTVTATATATVDTASIARAVFDNDVVALANRTVTATMTADTAAIGRSVWDNDIVAQASRTVSASCAGTGANTVTITVKDASDSTGINRFTIEAVDSASGGSFSTVNTNTSGIGVLNLDNSTWKITLLSNGWVADSIPAYLIVSGTTANTYYADAFSPGTPSAPTKCIVYCWIYDIENNPVTGYTLDISIPSVYNPVKYGNILIPQSVSTTDTSGYAEIEVYRSSELTAGNSETVKMLIKAINSGGQIIRKVLVEIPSQNSYEVSW